MAWSRLRPTARWTIGLGLPALLLALAWQRADPRAGAALLAGAGPLLLLAPLPFAGVLVLDALGWRLLLVRDATRRVSLQDAFAARVAGEAVAQTLPSAGIAGEAASAWLLARRTNVPLGQAIGGLAVRRLLLAPGHGIVLASAALAAASLPAVPGGWVATLGASATALLVAAAAGARLISRAAPFRRLQGALSRSPWTRLREWTRVQSVGLSEADREAERLLAGPWRRRAAAGACFTLVFVAEVGETLFLLRLLGAAVTPAQVLAFEPLVSLARATVFFVPAGLGVQDLGYLSLLHLLGIPNAAALGAAFVFLKRLKELLWSGAGWSLLLTSEARVPSAHHPPACQASGVTASRQPGEAGVEPGAAEDPLHLRVHEPDHADAPDCARAVGA